MENNVKIREELWQTIDGLTNDQVNEVVEEGKWTIAQVLEHLFLTEKVVVRSFSEAQQITEDNPVKLKKVHLTVDRSSKIDAPKYLVPTNEYQTLEQLKEKLKKSRESLEKYLEEVGDNDLEKTFMPHPFFGNLLLFQWVEFIGYHEKRHIEQIGELKKALR